MSLVLNFRPAGAGLYRMDVSSTRQEVPACPNFRVKARNATEAEASFAKCLGLELDGKTLRDLVNEKEVQDAEVS